MQDNFIMAIFQLHILSIINLFLFNEEFPFHLPQTKRAQILQIVEFIHEAVNSEKIILFGSHAKDTWVEDKYFEDRTNFEFNSDYDILIVTKDSSEKEHEILDKVINRTRGVFKAPVNAIIHDIEYVNEGLEIGQYFFTDIINEGVLLYDNNQVKFSPARKLSSIEMKLIAQRYFDKWFASSSNFLDFAINAFDSLLRENKSLNDAAFLLHQATEKLYNTMLLVFTGYKPKTHNLDKLRQYAKNLSEEIFLVFPFPIEDEFEKHLFDLLKKGYIDARYKDDYIITEEEFRTLITRVTKMKNIVEKLSIQRINSF